MNTFKTINSLESFRTYLIVAQSETARNEEDGHWPIPIAIPCSFWFHLFVPIRVPSCTPSVQQNKTKQNVSLFGVQPFKERKSANPKCEDNKPGEVTIH